MRKHLAPWRLRGEPPAIAVLAAFGPGLGRRGNRRPTGTHRHDLHPGSQRHPEVRRPGNRDPGRRAGNRQRNQPEKGRPAHLLAGHQRLAAEDRQGASELLHAEAHLHVDRPLARRSTRKPNRSRSTRPRPAPKAGARWAAPRKKGDSWFTGEKPGASFTQQVTADPATTRRSTSCARSIPGCRARSRSCRPAASGTSGQLLIPAPPGAPSFPRRPGRRRARAAAAAAAAAGGAAAVRRRDARAPLRRCRSGRGCRSRGC